MLAELQYFPAVITFTTTQIQETLALTCCHVCIDQPLPLRLAEHKLGIIDLRPYKTTLMQTALGQPHAVDFPQQQTQAVAGLVAKNKR